MQLSCVVTYAPATYAFTSHFAALSRVIPLGTRTDCFLIEQRGVFSVSIVFWKTGTTASRQAAVLTFEMVLSGTAQSIWWKW